MLLAPPSVSLRRATPGDDALVRALFLDARAADFALLPGEDAAIQSLIDLQFRAHSAMLGERYPHAVHEVILDGAAAIGRLVTATGANSIRLVDIAVLADRQANGVGTTVLRSLLDRADSEGLAVDLTVWELNTRATRLYERLGFIAVGAEGGYRSMRRMPHPPEGVSE